jgi:hypothetical protein
LLNSTTFGRPQRHADRRGRGGVIDAGEDRKVALFERREKALHGFCRRMAARDRDESFLRHSSVR